VCVRVASVNIVLKCRISISKAELRLDSVRIHFSTAEIG
jgi:hypothetical protein